MQGGVWELFDFDKIGLELVHPESRFERDSWAISTEFSHTSIYRCIYILTDFIAWIISQAICIFLLLVWSFKGVFLADVEKN